MKDPKTPVFSSQELQKVVEDARPILEGLDVARDRVSNDIKALEAYLQRLDLKESYRHTLGKSFVGLKGQSDSSIAGSLESYGAASGTIEEEALIWAEDRSGRFRLQYELSRWQGSVDIDAPGGPFFWDEGTLESDRKPLLETKFEIRKRMYSRLPDFIAGLAKYLEVDPRVRFDQAPL